MSLDNDPALDRHLPFTSVFNFRDLGGYPAADGRTTKWRTLFRADGVHRIAPADLAALGIRTVLDLRTDGEVGEGRFLDADDAIAYHHLPVLKRIWEGADLDFSLPAERFLADRYREMLDDGPAELGRAITVIADDATGPLVFHCAAGKDRTGVLAALVLSLVGVDDDVIAADYALSQLATDQMRAWVIAEHPDKVDRIDSQPTVFFDSPAAAMALFLTEVRQRHGSVEQLVAELGVDAATVDALRQHLLTD